MLGRTKSPERLGRQLAEEASRLSRYPLLILPSSVESFRLLEACEESGMPVRAAGNPGLVATWAVGRAMSVTTPRSLWSTLKAERNLACAVAVFEDQHVAVDDSYLRVTVDGHTYMVSPLLMMILMKFRPHAYLGRFSAGHHRITGEFQLTPYAPDLPPTVTQNVANDLMGDVLGPLLAMENDARMPWLARNGFVLKRDSNFYRVLVQQVQEMESLVRLCCSGRPEPSVPSTWHEVLRASRLAIGKLLQ